MMTDLDDVAAQRTCDPAGMLPAALSLPHQLREAWRLGRAVHLRPLPARPAHLVVAGMGGSAIGGDLLAAVLAPRLSIPVTVVRDARLPSYVGSGSLVVASSYSGETEETLAAAEAALDAGAPLLAVTSGGRLADLASRRGSVVTVPGGLAPRAALGYLATPVLAALERWEIIGPCAEEIAEATAVLDLVAEDAGPGVPVARNPAKQLAAQLDGRIPVVYAGAPEMESVARRWKCQFNENSKTVAMWNTFPELAHNESAGWGGPAEITGLLTVIVLLGGEESDRARRRIRLARDLTFRPAAGVHEVHGRGASRLARLFSLVLLGDLTSIYLAYLRGVDPTPIEAIDALKRGMREEGGPPAAS